MRCSYLFFWTLLFPRSSGILDVALVDVVLQVVGGKGYVVALLAETVTSLNLVKTHGKWGLRASQLYFKYGF